MLSENNRGTLTDPAIGTVSPLPEWHAHRTVTATSRAILRDFKCIVHHALNQSAIVKSLLTLDKVRLGF
jgi:hypothetical protein